MDHSLAIHFPVDIPGVGRSDLDSIHRRVAEGMNALEAALSADTAVVAMERAMALLVCLRADYVAEEALMNAFAYPDIQAHVAAHAGLEIGFGNIARRIRDAGTELGRGEREQLLAELAQAAGQMLAHVSYADALLSQYLNTRAAAP